MSHNPFDESCTSSHLEAMNSLSPHGVDLKDSPSSSKQEQSSMPLYKVRRMVKEDVAQVLEIWAANNLHEGTHTIQSFLQVDPHAFYVAVELDATKTDDQNVAAPKGSSTLDANIVQAGLSQLNQTIIEFKKCTTRGGGGKHLQGSSSSSSSSSSASSLAEASETRARVLGMCSGAFIHPCIAFIGMYAVRPELHGKGIGLAMWRRMMEHIGDRNAGLYAVPEHLSMYRDRAGFTNLDTRMLVIYESDQHSPPKLDSLVSSIRGIQVCAISEQHLQLVARYDSNIHGYSRLALLTNVFREGQSAAFVAFDVEDEERSVQGYGCIRTNNIGKAMIGPLYANNDAVAELIMRHLFQTLSQPFCRGLLYMTLDSNPGGERIADKLQLPKMEELPRLFRCKPYRDARWNHVYCIHTPNFSLL